MTAHRQPTLYLTHGAGPCFWIEFPEPFGPGAFEGLRHYFATLLAALATRPKAILIVSAHWEEAQPTVSTATMPPMFYDYQGFPDHTYTLNYPAPGAPELAVQVQQLLTDAGIVTATNAVRGFDHGVFVPMLIIDPAAQIPILMLSLQQSLDAEQHLAIGAALAPLRAENVLIIGSGSSYHNLGGYRQNNHQPAIAFDQWLNETVTQPDIAARNNQLAHWRDAPYARDCHPRAEHLLPLMVAAGAGEGDRGRATFQATIGGKPITCFAFGTD